MFSALDARGLVVQELDWSQLPECDRAKLRSVGYPEPTEADASQAVAA